MIDSTSPRRLHPTSADPATSPNWRTRPAGTNHDSHQLGEVAASRPLDPPTPRSYPRARSQPTVIHTRSGKWLHHAPLDLATSPKWPRAHPEPTTIHTSSRKWWYHASADPATSPNWPRARPEPTTIHTSSARWRHHAPLDPATSPNWPRARPEPTMIHTSSRKWRHPTPADPTTSPKWPRARPEPTMIHTSTGKWRHHAPADPTTSPKWRACPNGTDRESRQRCADGQAGVVTQPGRGSRAVSQSCGTPPGPPTPVYAATIPPTIAAVVSTSPPASTQTRIAAG